MAGPDTKVVLDTVTFTDAEVPEGIKFGGAQSLAVQKYVGGARTVDAMGRDDADLTWTGWHLGATALDRARYLDQLRVAGKQLVLSWSAFSYLVVIKSYDADFTRFYKLPYTITCTVVKDLTRPVTALPSESIDTSIKSDMSLAGRISDAIANSPLTTAMNTLKTATAAVSDFANQASSVINSVLKPLADAKAVVGTLIASATNTLQNVTTLGGIAPGNPIAKQAQSLNTTVIAATSLPQLYNLNAVLSRMGTNLGNVTGSQTLTPVSMAGGDLQKVAAKAYGDPTAWTTIARASGLTDPVITGVQNVKVPKTPDNAGGVFNV